METKVSTWDRKDVDLLSTTRGVGPTKEVPVHHGWVVSRKSRLRQDTKGVIFSGSGNRRKRNTNDERWNIKKHS